MFAFGCLDVPLGYQANPVCGWCNLLLPIPQTEASVNCICNFGLPQRKHSTNQLCCIRCLSRFVLSGHYISEPIIRIKPFKCSKRSTPETAAPMTGRPALGVTVWQSRSAYAVALQERCLIWYKEVWIAVLGVWLSRKNPQCSQLKICYWRWNQLPVTQKNVLSIFT